MLSVHPIPAFNDNYIWLIEHISSKQVVIVDPGDAAPVISAITDYNLTPIAILITHQHYDHINGVNDLVEHYSLPVFGQKLDDHDVITNDISNQAQFKFNASFASVDVIKTHGHAPIHLSYLIEDKLFCGDTLFAAGCGRLLDANARPLPEALRASAAKQLHESLTTLCALPKSTQVYCAHEYTQNNLRFAATVEPNNKMIQQRIIDTDLLCQQQKPSLPSNLALELETNPFIRCDQIEVIQSAQTFSNTKLSSPLSVFAALRKWKDQF